MIYHQLPSTTEVVLHQLFTLGRWSPLEREIATVSRVGMMYTWTLVTTVEDVPRHGVLVTPGIAWIPPNGRPHAVFVEFETLEVAEMSMLMGWRPEK